MSDTDKDKDLEETTRIMERLVKTPPKRHDGKEGQGSGAGKSVVTDAGQTNPLEKKTPKRG